jgi:hypothetical protein
MQHADQSVIYVGENFCSTKCAGVSSYIPLCTLYCITLQKGKCDNKKVTFRPKSASYLAVVWHQPTTIIN